jgi:hypothetical protein
MLLQGRAARNEAQERAKKRNGHSAGELGQQDVIPKWVTWKVKTKGQTTLHILGGLFHHEYYLRYIYIYIYTYIFPSLFSINAYTLFLREEGFFLFLGRNFVAVKLKNREPNQKKK